MDVPTHGVPEPDGPGTPQSRSAGPPPFAPPPGSAELPPLPPLPPAPSIPTGAPAPRPSTDRPRDPLAVALGNACALGVGYLLLGRHRLAATAVAGTVAVLSLVLSVARPWCEVVALVWWAAPVLHGWFLAGGWARVGVGAVRGQRVTALCVTLPVLLAVGLLRFDAGRIGRDVTAGRTSGDCAAALAAQGRVWFGNRLADAPLAARDDRTADACHRLATARESLATGLTGDTDALRDGFGTLAEVLAEPGNARTVDTVLNGFLGALPAKDPCRTVTVTDWLRRRTPSHDALDRSATTAARTAPPALVGCADDLMAGEEWKTARARYRQLLDQYPHDTHVAAARSGVHKATLTIELANVRSLLEGPTDVQPDYCSKPAKYSGAKARGKGTNRAMFFGNDEYTDELPGSWKTTDAAHAVLVVCAGDAEDGTAVRTCPYENEHTIRGFPTQVTFHKIAVPVKVYELRTGKKVADRKVQISGKSCPNTLHYSTYMADIGPPSDVQVEAGKDDVRAAFESLVRR